MATNQADLSRFGERLREMRDSIRSEIGTMSDETQLTDDGNDYAVSNHPADEATEFVDRERNMAVQAEVQRELAQIEHALERFEAGTYGLCEVCHKPIDIERLEARPAATLCIDHQRERDSQDDYGPDTHY